MNQQIFPLESQEVSIDEKHNMFDSSDDVNTIKSLIKGRLDVGVVHLTKNLTLKHDLEKLSLHYIPLRMTSQNSMISIVYRDGNEAKIKAHQLYDEIKKQMQDLHEGLATIKDFEKLIEKDEETQKLDKYFLYQKDDYKVYAVNGEAVRNQKFDEWVDGGHHYVDASEPKKEQKYAKHIPEDEIWVDDLFIIKPDDLGAILLHESLERHLMKFYGYVYSDTDKNPGAHEVANMAEVEYRKTSKKGVLDHETSQKIYDKFVKEWGNKHHKEKLNENYQFNKMKDLMKRIL